MDLYGIDTEAVRRFDTLLENGGKVTVTAHTHPDGDALGSVSALVSYLRECRGKDAVAVLPDSPADTVRFIVPAGVPLLCHDTEPEACLARIAESDLVIMLDGKEILEAQLPGAKAAKLLMEELKETSPECCFMAPLRKDASAEATA